MNKSFEFIASHTRSIYFIQKLLPFIFCVALSKRIVWFCFLFDRWQYLRWISDGTRKEQRIKWEIFCTGLRSNWGLLTLIHDFCCDFFFFVRSLAQHVSLVRSSTLSGYFLPFKHIFQRRKKKIQKSKAWIWFHSQDFQRSNFHDIMSLIKFVFHIVSLNRFSYVHKQEHIKQQADQYREETYMFRIQFTSLSLFLSFFCSVQFVRSFSV